MVQIRERAIRKIVCPGCNQKGTFILVWRLSACGKRIRWCKNCGTIRHRDFDGTIGFGYPKTIK